MPYIDKVAKDRLYAEGEEASNVGELTYLFTLHCLNADRERNHTLLVETLNIEIMKYLNFNGPTNYALLNGVVGSLECARREHRRRRPDSYLPADEALSEVLTEFYGRIVAPYEDTKIEQNGDVYL